MRPVPRVLAFLLAPALSVMAATVASPVSPSDERASFQFADPELQVELVAAEPLVTSPVSLAWDADGRLFVAEMNDYPTAENGGRIRRLDDRDGDGKMEDSVVFADDLHFPAGLLPWRDGLLVAAAPNVLFLRDRDGDGRADERRILLSGFGEGNQQLRVNGLNWALDGWVYGANGRSDGDIQGGGGGERYSLRRHDFRFRPETGEVEVIAGPSQFGLGFDAAGNRFLSWNTVPIRHEVIPEVYLTRQAALGSVPSLQDCLDARDDHRVYPLTPAPQTFNRESTSHFNALAGLHVFGGDGLGPQYVGNAFMGETLRNLVHRRILRPRGPTFEAVRAPEEAEREFLASSDSWCHPVNFATGPDGALYICDFYRRWVEHPGYVPEHLRGRVDWREGADHGRIWRVTSKRGGRREPGSRPRLSQAETAELVGRLNHPNAWHRITAQRLLVEKNDPVAVPALLALLAEPTVRDSRAPLHAIWILRELHALDDPMLLRMLANPDPLVRGAAVQMAESRLAVNGALADVAAGLSNDPDAVVRFRTALAAWALPGGQRRAAALEAILRRDAADEWTSRAVLTSCREDGWSLAGALLERPLSEPQFLIRLGDLLGAQSADAGLVGPLVKVLGAEKDAVKRGGVALLAGVTDGIRRVGRDPRKVLGTDGNGSEDGSRELISWFAGARAVLGDGGNPAWLRASALGLLAAILPPAEAVSLRNYFEARYPIELQLAAAERLITASTPETAGALFSEWSLSTSAARRRLASSATRTVNGSMALLMALADGRVALVEVDLPTRETLLRHGDPSVRQRAQAVFDQKPSGDRLAVVKRYEPVLAERGDRGRGAVVFGKNCAACHRVGGRGGEVGPDLSGISARPSDALLVDILDPSRQIAPDFLAYTIQTTDGEEVTGLLVAESETSVLVRRANLPDETIPRFRIRGMRAEGKSVMPEGLEAILNQAEVADLLAFLAAPDPALLAETR